MGFALREPATVSEAVGLTADAKERSLAVLAGGTDLLLDIDRGRAAPKVVVSLARLPWRYLRWKGETLTVGSTLPLRDLEKDPGVRSRLPGLYQAVRAVGGVALRNRATLGGNVARASPASDLLPILLAYDARVALVGPRGDRTVRLDELLGEPRRPSLERGELIASVTLPESADSAYLWQRVRPANDVSQVGVAVVRATGTFPWRIALGGVPPRAIRMTEVERLLTSPFPSETELEMAAQAAAASAPFVTDKRATEAYRRRVVTILVRRAVTALVARARPRSGSR